jgi:hypothetical protein
MRITLKLIVGRQVVRMGVDGTGGGSCPTVSQYQLLGYMRKKVSLKSEVK